VVKDITFKLDIEAAGQIILQEFSEPLVAQAGNAVAARAQSMATSVSSNPPSFEVSTRRGVIKRGTRAIATVKANTNDAHQTYIAQQVLAKAKDAGNPN
jgi:hypothetical protein